MFDKKSWMSMTCDDRGNLDWKSLVSLVTEQFITLRHPSGGSTEAAERDP